MDDIVGEVGYGTYLLDIVVVDVLANDVKELPARVSG